MAEDAIDKMKTNSSGVRLVLVGSGSVIILDEISGVAKNFRDKMAQSPTQSAHLFRKSSGMKRCKMPSKKRENNQP